MRLDRVSDGEFKPSDNFSISVKNHKVYFQVNNDKHVFGSKLYPVGKRGTSIFAPWQDVETGRDAIIEHENIAELLEKSNWTPRNGYCYTNAEILQKLFQSNGIDAKYYCGWVFSAGGYPIHHAWVVVDDRVYDISVNIASREKMQQQAEAGLDLRSKECVREVKEIEQNWKPIIKNFTWGQPQMIYIGAEATPTSARLQYDKATGNDISKHPSYRHMKKNNKFDMSPYQKLLNEV